MRELTRYKGEVIKNDDSKEYYFGPTVDETIKRCKEAKELKSFIITSRERGWVVARYNNQLTPFVPALGLKDYYELDLLKKETDILNCVS